MCFPSRYTAAVVLVAALCTAVGVEKVTPRIITTSANVRSRLDIQKKMLAEQEKENFISQ